MQLYCQNAILSQQACTLAANSLSWLVCFLLVDLFVCFILSAAWLSEYFQHQQTLLEGEAGLPRSICHCLPGWFSSLRMFLLLLFLQKQADGLLHNSWPGSPLSGFSSCAFLLTRPALVTSSWKNYRFPLKHSRSRTVSKYNTGTIRSKGMLAIQRPA